MKRRVEKPTVALDSLGCKLNQAEIQQLVGQIAAAGYRVVPPTDKADVYILNTCTVTHIADRKSRHLLRQARRRNPAVRLVAIGCYAERSPFELAGIEGVELVLGNEQKWRLLELLETGNLSQKAVAAPVARDDSLQRTRAFLKVQDGCRNFCAYCIVPLVRRLEASVPITDVLELVREKESAGFQEVVLTGTEIGAYKSAGDDLKSLLERILAETAIPRLRLSSLQPHQISSELIALWRYRRLCPHYHLSLQSGSDAVLLRMKRHYTSVGYQRTVALIREQIPDIAITTDVIVGFPGETDNEFKKTYDFCRLMRFARIHVFPYSPRPGTSAASMPAQVPEKVKKERVWQMLALAKESAQDFQRSFLGQTMEVLWEKKTNGVWSGLTGNYIKVFTKSINDLSNRLLLVKLVKIYRDGVWGEISSTMTDSISP